MLTPIKTEESSFVWLHRVVDLLTPIFTLYFITSLLQVNWHERYQIIAILGGFVFLFSAQLTGIYKSWRGRSLFTSFKLLLNAWVITWCILIIATFLYKDTQNFSRLAISFWAFFTPFSLIIYRLIIRLILIQYRTIGKNIKTVAIVGAGKVGQHITNIINNNQWMGYRVVAFFDDNKSLKGTKINNIKVIGETSNISSAVNTKNYNEVYLCLPLKEEEKIKKILDDLTNTTAIVKFVPDLFSFDLMHAKWVDLKGVPIISIFDTPLNSLTSRIIKRLEDIFLSTIILLLISPVMLFISIGIKVTSQGPIFYKQTRVGWNGKKFSIIKFRSMPVNMENQGVQWGNSKNKTNSKFGQFIRSTSLDELPQFLNVILGDMSIVGPRPERDIYVEEFRKKIPRYMQKHIVKAGITGWAQINGWRGDTSLEKRIEFDLHYINTWTLWLDIKIIFLTIFKGFINKNAY